MGNGGTRARFDRRGGRYTKGLPLLAFGIHEETSAMSGGDFPTEVLSQTVVVVKQILHAYEVRPRKGLTPNDIPPAHAVSRKDIGCAPLKPQR